MFDNYEEEIDFEEAQIRCKMMADDPLSLQYELEDYLRWRKTPWFINGDISQRNFIIFSDCPHICAGICYNKYI